MLNAVPPLDVQALRTRAEATLAKVRTRARLADDKSLRLLHELQVHQVELQMQNEQLLATHEALQAALRELRVAATAFDGQEGVLITDAEGQIIRVNNAFTTLTGFSSDEILRHASTGLKVECVPPTAFEKVWTQLSDTGSWQGEIWNRRKTGEACLQWLTLSAVCDEAGRLMHYVGTFSDITDHKKAEIEIHRLANYDHLTKLPNRRMFLEHLAISRERTKLGGRCFALLFIDLDNFKYLNDTRGHHVGDLMLVKAAERITSILRQSDIVARLGGDEFVVMIEGLDVDPSQASVVTERVGEKIRAALNMSYDLHGVAYLCSASLGATIYYGGNETPETLLKQADMAMYKAKSRGRDNFCFFDPPMQHAISERAALEAELRVALAGRQLCLYLHPEVDVEGRVCGAEALLRWRHPQRGLVAPGAFIPLAEATGLIVPIGRWVLRQAGALLAAWSSDPVKSRLRLAVNISSRQLRQRGFVADVERVLAETGADPSRLRLELVESALIEDIEEIMGKLAAVKALGVGLALDDFGTGFSSLSYLTRLPIDCLKIDGSFVQRLPDSVSDAIVARTIITMGQSLGMAVVAEGVETEAQRHFLLANKCVAFQGFLFSQPLPAEEFDGFLAREAVAQPGPMAF